MSFIQKYIYRGKTNEELVERRVRQQNMKKLDPSRDGWCKDETNGLRRFWYECSQLPTPMKEKRKSQAKRKEVDLAEQSKAIDERPQGLSAMVAKIQMDDISPDEELLERSDDNNDIDFASEGSQSRKFRQIFTKDKSFKWFLYI